MNHKENTQLTRLNRSVNKHDCPRQKRIDISTPEKISKNNTQKIMDNAAPAFNIFILQAKLNKTTQKNPLAMCPEDLYQLPPSLSSPSQQNKQGLLTNSTNTPQTLNNTETTQQQQENNESHTRQPKKDFQ